MSGPQTHTGLILHFSARPSLPSPAMAPVPRVTLGLGLAHLGHLLPGGDVPAFARAHPSIPTSLPRLPAPDGTSELTQSCLEKCSRGAASAVKVKGTHLGPKVIPDLRSRAATWPLCDTGLHLPPKQEDGDTRPPGPLPGARCPAHSRPRAVAAAELSPHCSRAAENRTGKGTPGWAGEGGQGSEAGAPAAPSVPEPQTPTTPTAEVLTND